MHEQAWPTQVAIELVLGRDWYLTYCLTAKRPSRCEDITGEQYFRGIYSSKFFFFEVGKDFFKQHLTGNNVNLIKQRQHQAELNQ